MFSSVRLNAASDSGSSLGGGLSVMVDSGADLLLSRSARHRRILQSAGAIILIHSDMETSLFALLGHFLKAPAGVIGPLFIALTNRARVDIIKRLAAAEGHVADERNAVEHAVRCFDICAENRNIIGHSACEGENERRFRFFKLPSTPGSTGWVWELTESDLLFAALDAVRMQDYIVSLWAWLRDRDNPSHGEPLPERPPQPRKLSLFRLPEDRPNAKPPPQS